MGVSVELASPTFNRTPDEGCALNPLDIGFYWSSLEQNQSPA